MLCAAQEENPKLANKTKRSEEATRSESDSEDETVEEEGSHVNGDVKNANEVHKVLELSTELFLNNERTEQLATGVHAAKERTKHLANPHGFRVMVASSKLTGKETPHNMPQQTYSLYGPSVKLK